MVATLGVIAATRGPAVRRGAKDAVEATDRRIQVVKGAILHLGGDLPGHAARRKVLVHHQQTARLVHRCQDAIDIQGSQGARVDHLNRDTLLGQFLSGLQGQA